MTIQFWIITHLHYTQQQFFFIQYFYYLFFVWIFNSIDPRISFQNRINNEYLPRPIFSVTFNKNILILSNSDSVIHFKLRSFRIRLNVFNQSRIISINKFFYNRTVIIIILLICYFIQIRKIRFATISYHFFYRF